MTFLDLQESYRQLRLRLAVAVHPSALPEITVTVPTRDDDELSFLRLVVWSYALVQEAGRVTLRFLRELPPFGRDPLAPEVINLRTWATHNLSIESASDQKRLKLAWSWLRDSCGVSGPTEMTHWRACFARLCSDVGRILQCALAASELLSHPEDGERLVGELRHRIERNWDGFRFDPVVLDVAARLGFEGVDVVEFRNRHLGDWRKVVSVAADDSIMTLLVRRVESDLLALMNDALPIDARTVVARLGLADPRELAALMLVLRARAQTSRGDLGALLVSLERGGEAEGSPD